MNEAKKNIADELSTVDTLAYLKSQLQEQKEELGERKPESGEDTAS